MSVFKSIPEDKILFRGELFFIVEDNYPVSPGHLLIISHSEKPDYFSLSDNEKTDLPMMIQKAKSLIEAKHSPDGFNIGMNCGESAGQTVMHSHIHLIPRRDGDNKKPRGGVRGVIPGKMSY